MTNEHKLSNGHWLTEEYTERMTSAQWRKHLLNEDDTIVVKGYTRKLKAKALGCGVVEIGKVPLK